MERFRSGSPDIVWPALSGAQAGHFFTLLFQFERSQWWDYEQILAAQSQQIQRLLQHATSTVPYYKQVSGGVIPELLSEQWFDIPILTRQKIQELGPKLNSTKVPSALGKPYPVESSGSTGAPVKVDWTSTNQLIWMAQTLREHLWQKRATDGVLATIRPDRMAKESNSSIDLRDWGPPFSLLYHTGPGANLNSRTPIKEQLNWLRDRAPTHLLSLPSNLRALAELSLESGERLQCLKGVMSFGETLDRQTRDLCRQAWAVEISDMYSAQEVGYIALQCPDYPDNYHVQSESVFIEVLDDSDRPCKPGQVGRLVLTPLHAFATPLFRYEIGDLVELGEPCQCGRGLPVLRRILGRQRNLATAPDGSRFWPSFPSESWRHLSAVKQIQLEQTSLDRIIVNYAGAGKISDEDASRLSAALRSTLGYDYQFEFSYHSQIPRSPSGKYEDFISRIA